GLADALHGTLQLRLGEPPWADLPRHRHLCRGGRGGVTRADPGGASSGTSRALDTTTARPFAAHCFEMAPWVDQDGPHCKAAPSFTELNAPVHQKPGCLGDRQEFAVRAQ